MLDSHPDFRQVVLRVREPRRRFETLVSKTFRRTREEADRHARSVGGRVLQQRGGHWVIERWTPEEARHYLCGFDERTLFIVQVPDGETVSDAHRSLLPEEVREAEHRWPGRVARQGEWFFVPVEPSDFSRIQEYARTHPRSARRDESVGPGGQPHVADEVIRLDSRDGGVAGKCDAWRSWCAVSCGIPTIGRCASRRGAGSCATEPSSPPLPTENGYGGSISGPFTKCRRAAWGRGPPARANGRMGYDPP
ncbi:MAG: hypothetical protein HYZ53_02445 [Planctomycetes bacterium]|nr:hypothetical protein [Planctomycetota bacterium]